MREFFVPLVLLLSACITHTQLSREASIECSGDNQHCSPAIASHLSLEDLKSNGSSLIVNCELVLDQITPRYRDNCQSQVYELAAELSRKWHGSIQPIEISMISLEESHSTVSTLDRGYDMYGIRATLPLQWVTN